MAGQSSVQTRIDAELKTEFLEKCFQEGVSQTLVIERGIQAFVQFGKWWEMEPEADEEEPSGW